MVSAAQSKLAAKLKKTYKKGYSKAKKAEAASGKSLPGGLRDAIGAITGMELEDSKYGPQIKVLATTLEPEEHKSVPCGLWIPLTDDRVDEEEAQAKVCVDLKALGFDEQVDEASDLAEAVIACIDAANTAAKKKEPYCFYYNTGTRANGRYFRVFPSEPADQPDVPFDPSESEQHEEEGAFSPGSRVVVTEVYDEDAEGEVVECDGDNVTIDFDDGEQDTVESRHVTLLEEEAEEEDAEEETEEDDTEEGDFEVGAEVETVEDYYGDGEKYTGTITAVDGDKITVEFEDGEDTLDAADLLF